MSAEDVALHNCASEPIHVPGRIQSFGVLLAFEAQERDASGALLLRVRQASANVTMLGLPPADLLLDLTLDQVFADRELVHAIRGGLGLSTLARQRERLGSFALNDQLWELALSSSGDLRLLELEPAPVTAQRPASVISQVRSLMAGLPVDVGSQALLDAACAGLRRLTGFDRVMAYYFLESGAGEVIAETLAPDLSPYLGLRYPASDIPQQVRDLMLRMPFRITADVEDTPVPMVLRKDDQPADLSLTHLRGVSPIHLEYLRNMGVRSTLNIAVVVHGTLWGMFALHHRRPRVLAPDLRTVCELFSEFMSQRIQHAIDAQRAARQGRVRSLMRSLEDSERLGLQALLDRFGAPLAEILEVAGMTVRYGGSHYTYGLCPPVAIIDDLCDRQARQPLLSTSALTTLTLPDLPASAPAGALRCELAPGSGDHLLLFREQQDQDIRWAGAPNKQLVFGPNGPRLQPRASFEEYRETVRDRSDPWRSRDVEIALELRAILLEHLAQRVGTIDRQRRREQERQDLVIAELNHRVKNILALVRSIAQQSRMKAKDLDGFLTGFEARLQALSKAHDLIGASAAEHAVLGDMLRTELRPYLVDEPDGVSGTGDRVQLEGPRVLVRPDAAPTLALILHELTSNAVKHGALAQPASLTVSWSEVAGGVELRWIEVLDADLTPRNPSGFGLTLLERAIPFEFQGECRVEFAPRGLRLTLWLPRGPVQPEATTATDTASEAASASVPEAVPSVRSPAEDPVLVLEDQYVLAMELEQQLNELGLREVMITARPEEALTLVAAHRPQLALLDVNLGAGTSHAVADVLRREGVPFLFVSGYDADTALAADLDDAPWLRKPVDVEALRQALVKLEILTP